MRDFPSCFGENGVQVAYASCSSVGVKSSPQNSTTCIYKCKFFGKSCLISIIWTKNLMRQNLSIEIDDLHLPRQCMCKVDVKPSLFSKRKGSKILQVINSTKIEVFWDLSTAKFGLGPEPVAGFYIAVVLKGEMVLLLGDLRKEAFKKTGAVASCSNSSFIAKREHIYGKRVHSTKAQFFGNGKIHDVRIECDTNCKEDPSLAICIDSKTVMQIKHLQWKFRGNYTISIDGLPVEVFWDVHNWLFGSSLGNGVFLFQSGLSSDKAWRSSSRSAFDSPVFDWGCLESLREDKLQGYGFSLLLYAWRNE